MAAASASSTSLAASDLAVREAAVAAFEGGVLTVEAELTLLLLGPVAFDAVLGEDGTDVLGEVGFGGGEGSRGA